MIYVLIPLVFLGIIITVLAYIGLKVKKQEIKDNKENVEKIRHFVNMQKGKKYNRASTPKVPSRKNE